MAKTVRAKRTKPPIPPRPLMVPKKHKSKRIPAAKRYKVEKKVREHNRKERKLAKKRTPEWRTKKDPGIPNAFPYKEEMLHEVEQVKQRKEEEKMRQKNARQTLQDKNRKISGLSTLQDFAKSAQDRTMAFDDTHRSSDRVMLDAAAVGLKDNSKKAYYKEFRKVIDTADVILEVLDARDPIGTRARDVEKMVMQAGPNKRLILVLNKIDLVPREVVQQWLTYLRHDYPTLAFKASTQTQRRNLGQTSVDIDDASAALLKSSECLGADTLMQLLKNYARNAGIKTTITVGIIGFPNVGKSSVINSLKRSKVCQVGSMPGITKSTQEVSLDKHIKLLDCPGIVFSKPKADGSDSAEVLLRNCVKVSLVEDPISPVELIIQRCRPEQMMKQYGLTPFVDVRDFLLQLAKQRGRLRRGGVPDLDATARIVLMDWNAGRIPYYTIPPARQAHEVASTVVQGWSKEFALPQVVEVENNQVLSEVKAKHEMGTKMLKVGEGKSVDVEMDSAAYELEASDDNEQDSSDEMEIENSEGSEISDDYEDIEEPQYAVQASSEKSKSQTDMSKAKKLKSTPSDEHFNIQHGKSSKQQAKKQKKQNRRMEQALQEALDQDGDDNDEFDFDVLK